MGDAAFSKGGRGGAGGLGGGGVTAPPPPPRGSGSGGGGAAGGAAPASYFDEFKKGEVRELLSWLREASFQNDYDKQREVVKMVVAYMTLGIDLSPLFTEMVKACNTRDIIQKKLVYLYLSTYAQSNPELSLLAVNTFQKDVSDINPMIRGLALRYLCSLRLPHLKEYMIASVQRCLNDSAAYVRKTAVIAIPKLYAIAPRFVVDESDWIDKLYEMLRDKDALVVCNAICALEEILNKEGEGGIVINRSIFLHLVSRFSEFSEWSLCIVLKVLLKYKPQEEEIFDLLNLLDDKLKQNNSALVLAVSKVFITITEGLPIRDQVFERLKVPLLTLMDGGKPEVGWAVLNHISLIAARVPHVFTADYKSFFCRYNDPSVVKCLKIDILTRIATDSTVNAIAEELSEYVRDVDPKVSQKSIEAIANVIVSCPQLAEHGFRILLSFLDWGVHVASTTFQVMPNILRRYPERAESIVREIPTYIDEVKDSEAVASIVWILGQHGDVIENSPYLLEDFVDKYLEQPPQVKLQLLTATAKLFFKRPGECQPILGRLFKVALDDFSNVDVRDRALFYYRLFQHNLLMAQKVIAGPRNPILNFLENTDLEPMDKIFQEWDSFSVVYGLPSERFIKDEEDQDEKKGEEGDAGDGFDRSTEGQSTRDTPNSEYESESRLPYTAPTKPVITRPLELRVKPQLNSKMFEQKWKSLPVSHTWNILVEAGISEKKVLEGPLRDKRIYCLASGIVGTEAKFYFYAQEDNSSAYFLVEMILNNNALTLSANFKSETPSMLQPFLDYFKHALGQLLTIRRINTH
ncbi:AP complex subunit beta [Balamuthia mandrillaris]